MIETPDPFELFYIYYLLPSWFALVWYWDLLICYPTTFSQVDLVVITTLPSHCTVILLPAFPGILADRFPPTLPTHSIVETLVITDWPALTRRTGGDIVLFGWFIRIEKEPDLPVILGHYDCCALPYPDTAWLTIDLLLFDGNCYHGIIATLFLLPDFVPVVGHYYWLVLNVCWTSYYYAGIVDSIVTPDETVDIVVILWCGTCYLTDHCLVGVLVIDIGGRV